MDYKERRSLTIQLKTASVMASLFASACGLLVLAGWRYNIVALKSLVPGFITMKPNSALGFTLAGIALYLLQNDEPDARKGWWPISTLLGRSCAVVVVGIGVYTLGEWLAGWPPVIDELMFKDPGNLARHLPPGRMAVITATNFTLLGSALLTLDRRYRGVRPANLLALVATIIATVAILGYLFGIAEFYAVVPFSTMALHSAVLFLLLSLACFCARPSFGFMQVITDDSNAGMVLRRLLPAAVLVPTTVGWLRLQGQRAGLYPLEFGVALHVASSVVIFSALIWLLARRMKKMDSERQQVVDASSWQQAILNSAELAIISTDLAGVIRTCNMGALQKLGYTAAEIIGKTTPLVFLDPKEVEQRAELLSRLLGHPVTPGIGVMFDAARVGISEESDWTYIHKNGKRFPMRLSVNVVYDQAGRPDGFLSIGKDITQQKLAEQALAKAGADLQNVIDHMPALVTYWDKQLKNRFGNKAYIDWFGLEPEKVRGQYIWDVVGEERYQLIAPRLTSVLAGNTEVFERVVTYKDRPDRHALFSYVPDIVNGEVRGMYGFVTDISQLHQAQEEKSRALETLKNVLDAATEFSIIATDSERIIQIFSKGAENILGYTADEVVGKHSPTLFHLEEEARAYGDELSRQYGRPIQGFDAFVHHARLGIANSHEWTFVRKDGGHVPIILTIAAIRNGQGDISGYVGIAKDISEDIAVRQALADARDRAEEASVTKSQFLANMSHEIRTPMNAILGMVQLLLQTELTARQRDYASKTQTAASSLLGLLNDILDFSKVEAGKMVLDIHPFRIDKLMRDLSVILSTSTRDRDVEILLDIDARLPLDLRGDAMRLQQVLINLAGNAVKFTRQGEVVVALHLVQEDAAGVEVSFSVRDSGIGIAAENLQHIFEGFAQAEASTTRRFGGTGLGLGISQRLVSLMGGELQVESTLGVGSRFFFSVRFQRGEEEAARQDRSSVALLPGLTRQHPLRVLVVDDNQMARDVLHSMVNSLGWEADVAVGGHQALKLLEQARAGEHDYDVVFMDWKMPDMDGWQTTCRIRQLHGGGETPVIIMVTALDRERLAERLREEPIALDGFLVKPVTASMLFDAVADARAGSAGAAGKIAQPALKRLQGLRLLVVEDNQMNQQVARELLSNEGASVAVASNGRLGVAAALDALPPFDAVLMDIQMPDMDGYTATAEIRRHIGAQTLPIIAMTANATADDRAACLNAGMDDHIAKPIDLDALVETILRHCERSASPATTAPAAKQGKADANDVRAEHEQALRRLGSNQKLFVSLASQFVQSTERLVATLYQSLEQGNKGDTARHLHTLKGTAGTMGAMELRGLASALEQKLDFAGSTAELAFPREEFDALVSRSFAELLAFADSLEPGGAAAASVMEALDKPAILHMLDTLDALMSANNMRATTVFAELQSALGGALGEPLAALGAAVNTLDFPLALARSQSLRDALT